MKKNVVADTSFFICNACTLKRYDLLLQYLDLYQFNAGNIITTHELPNMGSYNEKIRSKIRLMNPQIHCSEIHCSEIFKPFSPRSSAHLEQDGEYEAILIAIELSSTEDGLHCLILDDKSPKNLARRIPELKEKTHGTMGFITNSYRIDGLISKRQCIDHLKAIHQAWIESQKTGGSKRPCAMDEGIIKNYLYPLIEELENSNE